MAIITQYKKRIRELMNNIIEDSSDLMAICEEVGELEDDELLIEKGDTKVVILKYRGMVLQ